jgi:2-iminobutanoate/2-iminopropanoate deaminase
MRSCLVVKERKKTMAKRVIFTEAAPAAIGPYSQAIAANGFVFVSGQIPMDPSTGQLASPEVTEQAKRVLENLKAVLEAAGSSLEKVVKTTIYITDMNNFALVNEVYSQFFVNDPPARATVQISRLPKDVLVEIDAIALEA